MPNAELQSAAALVEAIDRELERRSIALRASPRIRWREPIGASLCVGERSAVVVLGDDRAIWVDLWAGRTLVGRGWSDVPDVVSVIDAFLLHEQSGAQLGRSFPWLEIPRPAGASASELVDEAWRSLLDCIRSECAGPMARLLPLAEAASREPALRMLMPFTSLNRLCFSRTTDYPFTTDCPYAWPSRDGHRVALRRGREETIIGTYATADEAVRALREQLPPGCGAAVLGTADDLIDG